MSRVKLLSKQEFDNVRERMNMYPFHMLTGNYKKAYNKVMGDSKAIPTEEQRFWIEHAYMEYERRSEEYRARLERTPLSKWPTIQLMNMARSRQCYDNTEVNYHTWPFIHELQARGYIVGWREGLHDYVLDFAKPGTDKARYLIPVKEW